MKCSCPKSDLLRSNRTSGLEAYRLPSLIVQEVSSSAVPGRALGARNIGDLGGLERVKCGGVPRSGKLVH